MGKKWLLLPGSELRVFCGIDQEQWDHVRPETEDEAKAFLLLQRWQGPGLSNGVVCARQPGCVLTSHYYYYYYYYYYCMGSCVFFSVCIMLYHTSNQPNLASNHPEFGQCKENTNTPGSTNLSPSFSIRALTEEVKSPWLMVRSVCWVHESPISQYVPFSHPVVAIHDGTAPKIPVYQFIIMFPNGNWLCPQFESHHIHITSPTYHHTLLPK